MKKVLIIFTAIFLNSSPANSQCPSGGESKDGATLSGEDAAFNKRKNKSARVPKYDPDIISISALKSGRSKKDDRDYWYEGAYVEINDAYLIDFKEQKGESCNCYEADDDKSKGDVHINIGNKRDLTDENNNYYVVIEITPSYKKLHPNYIAELATLKGKKITIRGYLFYDKEHERNSINYCETCSETGVWRKTCWEVHPVTFIGMTQ